MKIIPRNCKKWRKGALKYFHLHFCKLFWANIYEIEQGPYRAVHSGQGPVNTILCIIFTDCTLATTVYVYYFIVWGGGTEVPDFVSPLA